MGRVLADRHHADLYHSLQLLFEQRLGFELWTPVGREWWDAGYWRFGECLGDDRLARQYLHVDAKYEPMDYAGVWRTSDPAHVRPRETIWCCSLDWARSRPWAYVVATVQENQPGLQRFATEVGAQFVVQVGNTGQRIDWALDPLVISSSEMPLLGRGVVAHQEIASSGEGAAFAWAPTKVADRHLISSFVNHMPRIEPGWSELMRAERELPHRVEVYGHEGRDGNLHPVEAIGAKMAESGWAWHEKPHGDGFGHVIHAWAAIGRPLIGRASAYRGKLAAPFWQDLVTCIDLDVHPFDEALALIRDISLDSGRHAQMCRAMRAAFDAAVDYDRDEEAIRELLGLPRRR